LVQHYPAAKLWAFNELSEADRVSVGFFDPGNIKVFKPLSQLSGAPLANDKCEVLLMDLPPDAAVLSQLSVTGGNGGLTERDGLPPALSALAVTPAIGAQLSSVHRLAIYICDRFGGPVPFEAYQPLSYLTMVNPMRNELQSNVVPLSQVTLGSSRHRSLLFKAYADQLGIHTRFLRGSYLGQSHCWNILKIGNDSFVIDLLHSPGSLYIVPSPESVAYTRAG